MSGEKEEKLEKIRVRIAPAPTGLFHIGTARTALFNYLFAKKHQGKFILRIEDTDKERSKLEFEKDILQGLKYLGIEMDEKLYRQSERSDIYEKYIKKLLEQDNAYHCFCLKEELEAQKQEQLSRGKPPKYNGKCRNLSKKEIKENLKQEKSFVIRFKTPNEKIIFNDLIRGHVEFDSNLIGDIVIAKNLSTPLYNLAVVIDDFEMKISHIIRGEDHISNTPKQILLQRALGFPELKYAHLPLILGPDRTKLSKRHGATAVSEYQKQGYLAEALINFIALLGWNPGTEKEIFSMRALIKEFSLERVQKGGAVFNAKRLDWLNGFYIRQKSPEKLTELCIPYLLEAELLAPIERQKEIIKGLHELPFKTTGYKILETEEIINFDFLKKIVSIYQERLKKLSEISELTDFFFKDKLEYDKELLRWKEMSDDEIKNSLKKSEEIISKINTQDFNKENLKNILMAEAEIIGDRGKLLWPLRAALSGKKASATPFEIAEILGKQKTLKRLGQAKEIVSRK
ncbi:glutamate--tRNA ligase [Candidatus Parcubacteria bacterium]|nr:glutamate--tRNA ligase [Candidatus Parcubacteria bacterium]